jgi:hypothetical protein
MKVRRWSLLSESARVAGAHDCAHACGPPLFARCILQQEVHRNEQEANSALQQPRGTEKRAMRSPVDSILVFLQDGNVFLVLLVHLRRDECAVSNDNGEQDKLNTNLPNNHTHAHAHCIPLRPLSTQAQ